VPDPQTRDIVSGGEVDVSYLGEPCVGFATSQPDYRVNYTKGDASLLRFYFDGGGDATMVVYNPAGGFYCDDDSYGTQNPTIDFEDPISGSYDIWIGSYAQTAPAIGTLNITELDSNHPQ
jgi:hypothetical protein